MSDYQTLRTMGLDDIRNISHYKLSQKGEQEELKIYFKRPTGSSLSQSSTFSFARQHAVAADAVAQEKQNAHLGSDPVLMAAIQELNQLTRHLENMDKKALMLDELDRLEAIMRTKIQELRDDLHRIHL